MGITGTTGTLLRATALIGVLAIGFRTEDVVCATCFLLATYTSFDYLQSPMYMNYLRGKWNQLAEVEAEPMPELDALTDFSREKLLSLTRNFRDPVVIRNAFSKSESVQKWGREHFLEHYADDKVVAREMSKDSEGLDIVQLQRRTFKEFYGMLDKGRNVSIIASSTICYDHPELMAGVSAPGIEHDLVGLEGNPILAYQIFMTPGGRTWFHSEVGSNVFRQVAGQKRWNVISPEHNSMMCANPIISGGSVYTCIGKMSDDERDLWVKRIPRQTALLNPGDILINAPWWWHEVQSIGAVDEPQFSLAGRMVNLKATVMNAPVQTINALYTRIVSKIFSGAAAEEDVAFEVSLETNIVDSYLRECLEEGKYQCVTDP